MISTSRTLVVSLGAILGIAFSVSAVSAWTGPTASAPNSNIAAPVNVGSSLQVKSGDLTTNSHTVYGDLKLNYGWNPTPSTITYLNFSNAQNPTAPTWGLNGYGIRDNNGTLEFKNSGDTGGTSGWKSLQTIISGFAGYWVAATGGINYAGGNVGINTATPSHKLNVVGSSVAPSLVANNGIVQINTSSSVVLEGGSDPASPYAFWFQTKRNNNDGSSWPITLNPLGGNVGVGTVSPGYKLDVSGQVNANSTSGSGGYVSSGNYGGTGSAAYFPQGLWSNGASAWIYGAINTNGAIVDTSNRMALRPSGSSYFNGGNLGVGTVSPSWRLSVFGPVADWAVVVNWPPGTPDGYGILVGTGASYYSQFQNASGYYSLLAYSSWGLSTNGNVGAAGFYYTSDQRLKDDVKPLNKGLLELMKLKPVSFTWNKDAGLGREGKNDIGLIAQDVEKIFPGFVTTDEKSGNKMVDYPKLIPVLIKSVQEQEGKIHSLEARIAALEAKLAQ